MLRLITVFRWLLFQTSDAFKLQMHEGAVDSIWNFLNLTYRRGAVQALRPNLNAAAGAKSVDASRLPPRGACHGPRKSGVLTIERRVIMAISSTTHQGHPERLGTSTEQ